MALFLVMAYLLGSVPFGLLLALIAGVGDIRKIGSGNIGATNVLRTGNKALAALTVLLDGGKGALIIGLYAFLHPYMPSQDSAPPALFIAVHLCIGLGAVVGHIFPVWLGFKGGKGFATTLGVLLIATPWAGLSACGAWILTAALTRLSSLSALVALASALGVVFVLYGAVPASVVACIVGLVTYKHKDNIVRLWHSTEPRMGAPKEST